MRKRHHTRPYSLQPPDAGSVRGSRGGALVLLAGILTSQGCYMYRPAAVTELEAGEEVRVTLSEQASRAALPGAPDARRVEGRFTEATPDSLTISVWIGAAYRGTPFESTYQHVALPRLQVVAVEDRQLSKSRTALVAAGVVAIIVTMIDQLGIFPIFTGDGTDDLPIPPEPEGAIRRR
ncbi:MAG: hypothetical protein ACREK1_06410 [Longimicrobiales bacterium]